MIETISIPASFAAVVFRIVLATFCGAAIGVNRELRVKPAGLRTHALVALGAAVVTLIGLELGSTGPSPDATATSRVLQGILAGIGFIGGGAILRRPEQQDAHGLTTAASIWVVAAVGAAIGVGLWRTAIVTVVVTLFVLTVGQSVDSALYRFRTRAASKEDIKPH